MKDLGLETGKSASSHRCQVVVVWKPHNKGRSEGGLGRKARGSAVSHRDGKILPSLRGITRGKGKAQMPQK